MCHLQEKHFKHKDKDGWKSNLSWGNIYTRLTESVKKASMVILI